ncbi:Hypothetical Protein FCC1311_035012 [Hondaea fermentalgiana]|uniref:CSC1/OSCA1-like cytosolic domain-containing protein n=1 Tax=Hondaea fermentalgiana TaxID=2315210 RepID=A0A2R5GAF8_9STRA|nr:Hypothetical Protein FCC1311_035012 [Hondaea fermentalgiana]|eukprot:GBG27279.1 Hypothetical Protein FCC1311_035012 [Hondaea fermentalgiana]
MRSPEDDDHGEDPRVAPATSLSTDVRRIGGLDEAEEARTRQVLVEIFGAQLGGLGVRVVESTDPTSLAVREKQAQALQDLEAYEVAELVRSLHIAHLNQDLLAEYQPPDRAKAIEYRALHHPHQDESTKSLGWISTPTGSFSVPCIGRKRDLIRFGSGISSYFKYQKLLVLMYICLFLMQLPVMLTNHYVGGNFKGAQIPLGSLSLGNMHQPYDNTTDRNNSTNYYAVDTRILCASDVPSELNTTKNCFSDSDKLSTFYGVMDALTGVVFLLFVGWLKYGTSKERKRFRQRVLKLEHYSVMVKSVPHDCTVEKLRDHFSNLCKGAPIYDVQIVSATGDALSLCVQRGKRIQDMARADAHRRRAHHGVADEHESAEVEEGQEEKDNEKSRSYADRRFHRLYDEVIRLDKMAAERATHGAPLFAFVTFEKESDRERCLSLYNMFQCTPGQHAELRLEGHPLKVSAAPPPSTLLWENHEFDSRKRRIRQFGTLFLMLVLLLITVAINYFSEPFKLSRVFAQFASGSSASEPCKGAFVGVTDVTTALDIAKNLTAAGLDIPDETRSDFTYLDCLCESSFTGALPFSMSDLGGECSAYMASLGRSVGLQVLVSFLTLLVNTAVFLTLSETAVFLHHSSVVAREMSILRRLFVTSYINVALLILIANTDFASTTETEFSADAERFFGNGSFTDFSAEWYRVAGAEVTLLALLNIIAPHFYPLLLATYNAARRRFGTPISHAELKEMSLGPDFVLSYRISQALVMTYLVMSYGTGLPVLYPIGAMCAMMSFAVDKLFFTKICRTPVEFSTTMQRWGNNVMEWAIIPHILFGTWMLSCPDIFPSSSESQFSDWTVYRNLHDSGGVFQQAAQRFTRVSAIPNMLLLFFFLGWRVFTLFGSAASRIAKAIYFRIEHVFSYWLGDDAFTTRQNETLTFEPLTISEAINQNKLSGIKSYFILENPRYQRYFPDLHQERALHDELRSTAPGIDVEP